MKAIFSPGPSYSDPRVREVAGWVKILDMYHAALRELGFDVVVPEVPFELIERRGTVSTITSYDLVAASKIPMDAELFLGPPGYSVAQMMRLGPKTKKVIYFWNNADWWRDQQLDGEYKRFAQPYDLSPTWRWLNAEACRQAYHAVACSPFVKQTWSRVMPPERTSIAFWGVDSTAFCPAIEPVPCPPLRVLFSGGDYIRKGLVYLGHAMTGLKGVELWIVGHGPVQIEAPGLVVRQIGMVPHARMPEIMAQCHVICIPTLEDGIALAVQEALACGLPAITTPDAGEVMEDGVSGFVVPFRDPGAIRQKLILLQNDQALLNHMGQAARALAVRQTWGQFKQDFAEVIRRVMAPVGMLPFESEMPWLKREA